jgi:hypothetical protein
MMTLVLSVTSLLLACQYSVGYPLATGDGAMPLWRFVRSLMTDKVVAYLAGFLILTVSALMLQRLNLYMNIIRHNTKLPFLMFFIFGSMNLNFLPYSPASVAMLFFLPALFELFRSEEYLESKRAFNATAMMAIGSLIWVYALWFIPICWYGMYRFKLMRIRNLIATVFGFLTVYWLTFGWCVWRHDFTALSVPYHRLTAVDISFPQDFTHDFRWMSVACIYMLLLIVVFYIRYHGYVNSLRTRQTLSFFLVMATYAFILFFFINRQQSTGFLYFFYMPAAFIFACFFSGRHGVMAFLLYYTALAFMFMFALVQIWLL